VTIQPTPHRRLGRLWRTASLSLLVAAAGAASVAIAPSPDAFGLSSHRTATKSIGGWSISSRPAGYPSMDAPATCFEGTCFTTSWTSDNNTEALIYSRNGGRTWSNATAPQGDQIDAPRSCQGQTCVATGSASGEEQFVVVSTDLGSTWSVATTIGYPDELGSWALDCSGQSCMVVATDTDGSMSYQYSSDAGVNWSQASVPAGIQLEAAASFSCVISTCLTGAATSNDGDSSIARSTDGGAIWSLYSPLANIRYVGSPTCGQGGCVAGAATAAVKKSSGGNALLYSSDDGANWRIARLPSAALSGVYTPMCTSSTCVSAGSIGRDLELTDPGGDLASTILFSTDRGASWQLARVPSANLPLEEPQCWNNSCIGLADLRYVRKMQENVASKML
jgi:hypothetical protein